MSFWPFPKTLLDELSAGLEHGPGLELGTGGGRLRDRLASVGVELLGSDLNARCDVRANALDLPFRAGSFGLVVAGNLIRHIAPTVRARLVGEAVRVLRPGGRLLLLEDHPGARTPAETNYRTALELLARVDASRGPAVDLEQVVRPYDDRAAKVTWSELLENEEEVSDPFAPAAWIEAQAGDLGGAVSTHRQEVAEHGMEYGRFQAVVLKRTDPVVES